MSEPACDRFERDGLGRWDAGAAPSDHERGCDDCQRARARYARIVGALKTLPLIEPPAGWQERVLERIDRPGTADVPSSLRWTWALAAALVVIAATVVLQQSRTSEPQLALMQEVLSVASARRADSAVVGDRLRLHATLGGAPHGEVRVYRGEHELVLRCPGDPRCRAGKAGFDVELALDARGSYRAAVLAADVPLAAPRGSLDDDARAAGALGGRIEIGLAVDVE